MQAKKIFLIFFIISTLLLVFFVETTLQTSVIFDRAETYSLWLKKIGVVSFPDIFIIINTFVVCVIFIIKGKIFISQELKTLLLISSIYLLIGALYNAVIYFNIKTYMYDIKCILFLFVPYLVLNNFKQTNLPILRKFLNPKLIIIIGCLGALFDTCYINLFGEAEYPSVLGLPIYAALPHPFLLILLLICTEKKAAKILVLTLIAIDVIGLVNKITLTLIYYYIAGFAFSIIFLMLRKRKEFVGVLSFAFILIEIVVPIYFLTQRNSILQSKSDGVITRNIQWDNYIANSKMNIPGIIGKGLGTTWFEIFPIPEADIYSVGSSLGNDIDKSMNSKVKFIFNIVPAGILYKWGFIGSILIAFYMRKWLLVNQNKPYVVLEDKSKFLGMVAFLMFLQNLMYVGVLRTSLYASILIFWAENEKESH